jgi:hypothetical protein
MHESKADKGDITDMKRSYAVGQHTVKLALFWASPHEGIEPQQDPEQLVLFEPGLCLRGAGSGRRHRRTFKLGGRLGRIMSEFRR